jgi:diaminopimelate epimerase
MRIAFTKAEAAGNDLIIADARMSRLDRLPDLAQSLCDRHCGIGGDGLLIIQNGPDTLPFVRMFNPDGTEDFCGNGIRCVAAWLIESGEADQVAVAMRSSKGTHDALVVSRRGRSFGIEVGLVTPAFEPAAIPAEVDGPRVLQHVLEVGGRTWSVSSVNVGTAHTLIFLEEEVDEETFQAISPLIGCHPIFPQRTSILWCRVETRQRILMRVWERGVGETFSCGSGACAAVVIGRMLGLTDDRAEVVMRGGCMTAAWDGSDAVRLTGPVRLIYAGEYKPA